MAMGSLDEKMRNMPRVTAEAGEMVVIETTKNGVVISEVICYVDKIGYDLKANTSTVELKCFDPHFKGKSIITTYSF